MPEHVGMSPRQELVKRSFDVVVGGAVLVLTSPLIAVGWLVATVSTRQNGLFRQVRVGRHGELFEVLKLRSMRTVPGLDSTVTTSHDIRVTRAGAWLRRLKLDELPQLVNVLRGEMSLVGPRPDVPGFADVLTGRDRVVLALRPGITGPGALAYRHEEALLAGVPDPERYNREVIWPDKVRLNREYAESWTLVSDVRCLVDTVRTVLGRGED